MRKTKIETGYIETLDITSIFAYNENGTDEPYEFINYYHGKPNDEDTKFYVCETLINK